MTPPDRRPDTAPDAPRDDEARDERAAALLASPSYRLAFEDADYLLKDELRPYRLALEFLKPELILEEQGIESTIVVFGSARTPEPEAAARRVRELEAISAARPDDHALARELLVARRQEKNSRYYAIAREFSQLVSNACQHEQSCNFVVVTGSGPGIMEAANRGAFDVGAKSIGLNITLPHEQGTNPYITPVLCFQFRYFAIRKMHFMIRARAIVVLPGGFGTMDELFEVLTLVQTRKVEPIPIILCGRDFWQQAINLEFLAEQGTISPGDLDLISYAETATEIWERIRQFYDIDRQA